MILGAALLRKHACFEQVNFKSQINDQARLLLLERHRHLLHVDCRWRFLMENDTVVVVGPIWMLRLKHTGKQRHLFFMRKVLQSSSFKRGVLGLLVHFESGTFPLKLMKS